jgi:hypothetical protein
MVEISKTALGLLLGSLVLSLMGLSFLLGRQSVNPVVVPMAAVTVTVTPSPVPVAVAVEVAVSPTPSAPAVKKFPAEEAAEVRAYLDQVEAISAGTEELGNPADFANNLLNQALMGDTSGIDSLLSQTGQSQLALSKIHPPASCKEHYQLLGAQIKASLHVLHQLKTALVTSDTAGLAGLAGLGSQMQAQAQRLQRVTHDLRERS